MFLSDITVVRPSQQALYRACDELCFLSKNLYNKALFIQRQNYFDRKPYLSHFDMINKMREMKEENFYALPSMPAEYVRSMIITILSSLF